MEKSIILPWTEANIENTPNTSGVLMLRTTPVNGDIVLIQVSSDIKADFLKLFKEGGREEVKYFDWFATTDLAAAEEAKKDLMIKYHLVGILE